MSADDLGHGIRTLMVIVGPDDFTVNGIDEARLMYKTSLQAALQGVDLFLYEITHTAFGASIVDGQSALALVMTLTPRQEPAPPTADTNPRRLRVVDGA